MSPGSSHRGRVFGGVRAGGSLLCAITVAIQLGCSNDGSKGPRAVVVDSAGVRVVSYDLSEVPAPVYRELGIPDLEIGVVDGEEEYVFSGIADVALVSDDVLVVSDGGSQELRVFDGEGRYLRSIGQRGEGPGEFAVAPIFAGTSGDTLFAFDSRSGRVSTFTVDGKLLATTRVTAGGGNRVTFLTRRWDGSYLALSSWLAPSTTTVFHDVRLELDSVVVEHLDADGVVIDTMRVMADRNRLRLVQDAGAGRIRTLQADPPYMSHAFLRSSGTSVVLARSDALELDIEPAGTKLRVLGAESPVTAQDIRARQEARVLEAMQDRPLDPMVRQLNLDFLPERLPAFSSLRLGESGDIWVAEAELDGSDGYDWLVFSPDGQLRGSVRTPPNMRLLVIRTSHVIGVVTDDLDVPYVKRYPLIVPGEG